MDTVPLPDKVRADVARTMPSGFSACILSDHLAHPEILRRLLRRSTAAQTLRAEKLLGNHGREIRRDSQPILAHNFPQYVVT